MATKGDLKDISLTNLVQLNCQAGISGRLTLRYGSQTAEVYFGQGSIVHAVLGDLEGKAAFYKVLGWETGEFELDQGPTSPAKTITDHWSDLLLDGLHKLDEQAGALPGAKARYADLGAVAEELVEPFALDRLLADLVEESTGLEGAVVVSYDGLVITASLPAGADAARMGASAAALLGLGNRTTRRMGRGDCAQAIIQGEDGSSVIIVPAGDVAIFVGLTATTVNLGMVVLEAREAADVVAGALM